jgi:nitroreductase
MMDVIEAIKTRRSIRKYQSRPVDDANLNIVLEAARLAPSWKNNQCWRFVVVRDVVIKSRLADTLISMSPVSRTAVAIKQAPVLIVACAEIGKSGYDYRQPDKPRTDKGVWWYMFDIGVAMQNLVLAARALGLGTVHIGEFDAGKAAEILHVPSGFCVVAMTPLGYPDEQPEAKPRKELSEIVFCDDFGANLPKSHVSLSQTGIL